MCDTASAPLWRISLCLALQSSASALGVRLLKARIVRVLKMSIVPSMRIWAQSSLRSGNPQEPIMALLALTAVSMLY